MRFDDPARCRSADEAEEYALERCMLPARSDHCAPARSALGAVRPYCVQGHGNIPPSPSDTVERVSEVDCFYERVDCPWIHGPLCDEERQDPNCEKRLTPWDKEAGLYDLCYLEEADRIIYCDAGLFWPTPYSKMLMLECNGD